MIYMMKRGQFNFVWLFAIIVGGAILFLAIYGALKTADTRSYQQDTEIAKKISILIDPLQAGFSVGSYGSIIFKKETKIRNVCFENVGFFGKNTISVSTRSDIGEEWKEEGIATSINSKYIFSSENLIGTNYHVFSKPFEFPYKVSDLIFLTSKDYCFIGAPEEIEDEILNMGIPNIKIDENNCTAGSEKVCFGSEKSSCDILVSGDKEYTIGTVSKDSGDMAYVGNLMYAAIFSEKRNYDCNVERLMYRTAKIAEELMDKSDLMGIRGCNTNLKPPLSIWKASTINSTVEDLRNLNSFKSDLDDQNQREICGLW